MSVRCKHGSAFMLQLTPAGETESVAVDACCPNKNLGDCGGAVDGATFRTWFERLTDECRVEAYERVTSASLRAYELAKAVSDLNMGSAMRLAGWPVDQLPPGLRR